MTVVDEWLDNKDLKGVTWDSFTAAVKRRGGLRWLDWQTEGEFFRPKTANGKGRMPAYAPYKKKTGGAKPKGIGATARAKKATVDEYGYKASSSKAMISAAVKAETARLVAKNIETQHSYCLIQMNHVYPSGGSAVASAPSGATTTQLANERSGFVMVGLNDTFTSSSVGYQQTQYNSMLMFNLSALSQVRQSSSSAVTGFRQGNKITSPAISVTINGGVAGVAARCKYYAMIARRKDGAGAGSVYQTPQIVTSDLPVLFKPMNEGPLATTNTGYSTNVPVQTFLSTMRRNTDAWAFVQDAMTSQVVNAFSGPGTVVDLGDFAEKIEMSIYHRFAETWDFTTQTAGVAPVLRGGDYYLFVWREGPADVNAISNLNVQLSLSFKDG